MNQDENALETVGHDTDQPITREALYELVWSEPMLKVAARFGVSSSYLARVCALLNVPRPERGYWAKLAVGKAPRQPALPDARPGDELFWSRDGHHLAQPDRPLPKPPVNVPRRRIRDVKPRLAQHPLIAGAKALFEVGRRSYEVGYLKPAKKLLVDLAVSKTALDKALAFANELFLALEEPGDRVVIAPSNEFFQRAAFDEREVPRKNQGYRDLWSPRRCTVVYIGTVAVGLTIIEMSEQAEARYVNGEYVRLSDFVPPKRGRYAVDRSWTTSRDFPSGRLCLQAYSPYPRANWTQQWRETKQVDISSRISAIVKDLEQAVPEIARLVEEGERQAEQDRQRWAAQQAQWQREEAARRAAEALRDSKEELLQIIEMWASSKRLEAFFADAETRLTNVAEDQRDRTRARLQRGRELIGSVDALERFRSWRTPEER